MANNVLDFESCKQAQLLKQKEARVDELRKAFRLARGESDSGKPSGNNRSGGSSTGSSKSRARNKKK